MPPRRALRIAALAAAALIAAGPSRAQDAGTDANGLRGAQTGARTPSTTATPSAGAANDEPLRRLDPNTLAGGDYGTTPPPNGSLAGGDYGRTNADQPVEPPVSTIDVGDPLARQLDIRPGSRGALRPRRPPAADDPYAPTGIRAGAFILRPTLETAGGYDSNPDRLPSGGKTSKFLRLRGDLDATSDWSRHQLEVRLSGQVRRYVDLNSPGYEPEANATIDGRIDVTDRTQIITELRSSISTSRPGDPDTPTDVKGDEIQKSYGATLGVAQRFNRFSLRLDGLVDRYLYDDAKLLNGETLDNSDRIYNSYEVRLRGAYELSPSLQPFAEIAVDTRDYDKRFGDDGRLLGSTGYALRTGATFEATRLITGELGVGYGAQDPKDKDLKTAGGLLVDGSIAWTPTALTTVRFNAKSALQETVTAGAGGILSRTVGVEVEHALRRNWTVTAKADFERSQYKGIGRVDDTVVLALETEYRLNRSVSLIGSFEHDRLTSNAPGENYQASIIEFGLRFRR